MKIRILEVGGAHRLVVTRDDGATLEVPAVAVDGAAGGVEVDAQELLRAFLADDRTRGRR